MTDSCGCINPNIVAIDKVAALEGNLIHVGEVKIPVGASYRARVLKELF